MILWMSVLATPQFTPVLNALTEQYGLEVHAHYLGRGTGQRGWGDQDLRHRHTFHDRRCFLCDLCKGWNLARTIGLRAVVVLGYNRPMAMGLLLGSRLRRIPVFTLSDSDVVAQQRKPLIKRLAKGVVLRLLYPRTTRVWAISASNAAYWRRHGLRNQRRIPFESPVPDVPGVERATEPTVLYVGRVVEERGAADAVDAVRIVRRRIRSVRLIMVGPGELSTIQWAAESSWVERVGPVEHDRLGAFYAAAHCLVVPSHAEAYGLVVREALQFGLPVVASTGVPAAIELCDRGWNLVPPRDCDALAAAIERVLLDPYPWPVLPLVDTTVMYAEELERIGGLGCERWN